jgi:ADP-heptose:LPS heptosyltransferase
MTMGRGILAIRPRALGDVVLTTPALRALHRGHPDEPLDVVTEPRYAVLLEGLPGVTRVLTLGRDRDSTAELAGQIRRRGYGRVVDFFGNPRSALLTWASGARETYGYDVRGRRFAYRTRVARDPGTSGGRREYAAATHVRLARAAGGVSDGLHSRVSVPGRARAEADRLLEAAGLRDPARALGLVAAGTWPTKTWPASHAARFARSLRQAGREVLLLAGPGEERVTGLLTRLVPGLRVLPPCDVGALAGVIARLGGVVGTDSGPRHLAAALGVPTFAWFGPTHPDNWTPDGDEHGVWWTSLPCRGCGRTACPHWNCLPGLHPEGAAELALRHFERHVRTTADLGPAAGA